MLASLHPCRYRENRFRRRETKRGDRGRGRKADAKKSRKSSGLDRCCTGEINSKRRAMELSRLSQLPFIPSSPPNASVAACTFQSNFFTFFSPHGWWCTAHRNPPPKCVSRCRLYRRRRDIRGFRRKSRYNMANVVYYYDKLLRVKIYPLHCTYFIQAFMKYIRNIAF